VVVAIMEVLGVGPVADHAEQLHSACQKVNACAERDER